LDSARLKRRLRDSVAQGQLRYTEHALQRMDERGFLFPDVERILRNGTHDQGRDMQVGNKWRYRISGSTIDGIAMSVVVEVDPELVVITVIG
jgi:hypothetical protein